jgi:hypothetical protein
MAQLAQQPQQPGADMVLAQAEMLKGQAANKEADIRMFVAQNEAQNKQVKATVEGFNAETKRMDTQVKAQQVGAEINNKEADTFGKQLDNQNKIIQLRQPANMSDEDILAELMAANE